MNLQCTNWAGDHLQQPWLLQVPPPFVHCEVRNLGCCAWATCSSWCPCGSWRRGWPPRGAASPLDFHSSSPLCSSSPSRLVQPSPRLGSSRQCLALALPTWSCNKLLPRSCQRLQVGGCQSPPTDIRWPGQGCLRATSPPWHCRPKRPSLQTMEEVLGGGFHRIDRNIPGFSKLASEE